LHGPEENSGFAGLGPGAAAALNQRGAMVGNRREAQVVAATPPRWAKATDDARATWWGANRINMIMILIYEKIKL